MTFSGLDPKSYLLLLLHYHLPHVRLEMRSFWNNGWVVVPSLEDKCRLNGPMDEGALFRVVCYPFFSLILQLLALIN